MIELRWLVTEIEVPYYSNPPVYGEKARFKKTKRRKLQYRTFTKTKQGYWCDKWSDWIDVPEVSDE